MKKIIIYGGTSLISIELIIKFDNEVDEFLIFCRNKHKFINLIKNKDKSNLLINKIKIFEVDLINLKDNVELIKNLKQNYYDGVLFVSGETGDPELEFEDYELCLRNYKINLLHPVILINAFVEKLKVKNSFICVFTSVAGIRGRALRLYYCSAKSGLISYLSGLRQKLHNKNILVSNVIAGYMNTEKFKYSNSKFLVSEPIEVAKTVYNGILKKRVNIYTSFKWLIISLILKIIPEKIFKKLKF